jgi:hypothetical protein
MRKKIDYFRNPFVSASVSYIILAFIALFYFQGWILLFSVFLSFVLSDIILNFFIRGGKKWAKVGFNNEFACKGHAYLVFLVGIVVGTLVSSVVADGIMKYLQSMMPWYYASLVTDLIVVGSVLGDLLWRFY